MPLYAVCLAESVEDDKLVSVVKANSSEEAIEHHFRKFVCASEIMKSVITDFSSEGFFYKYFDEFEWDAFRNEFAFVPNFIDLMARTHKNGVKLVKSMDMFLLTSSNELFHCCLMKCVLR